MSLNEVIAKVVELKGALEGRQAGAPRGDCKAITNQIFELLATIESDSRLAAALELLGHIQNALQFDDFEKARKATDDLLKLLR